MTEKARKKAKAIALVSGGLDSLLAARAIMDQGVEVHGVAFTMSVGAKDIKAFARNVRDAASASGIPLETIDISEDFLAVLKNPRHGYGAHINPCIDCKILMLKKAKELMIAKGADFVITGEVLGERPMSQRKDALDMIQKGSSLGELLLRPLSAKLLKETKPEREGLVDRDKLYAIKGRSRKEQFELAKKFGITRFFQPAGGCLLADPAFSKRVKDLIDHDALTPEDIALLKRGRHFRIDSRTKIVIGRDERDNGKLVEMSGEKDVVMRLKDKAGPYGLLRGKTDEANIRRAAAILINHSKERDVPGAEVEYWSASGEKKTVRVETVGRADIEKIRV